MADPLGIIGVIAVAGHIIHLTIRFGRDMKSAPEDAKSFLNEIQTLKTVLSETHNIIANEDFKAAFEGRKSALLLELGDPSQPMSTFSLAQTCKQQLDDLLFDLKKRTEGGRLGWERLKGAFVNKRTKETVQDLYRQCQTLNSLISLDALSLGLETHKEVKHAAQEQRDWQKEQKSKEILDWLSKADHQAQQSDFLRRRQAGTGQWLLDSQEYRQWVATPQTTLFCPGIPGAGKTVLTSIVVNDLQDRVRDDDSVSIAYLYCNFRRQEEQTVENLLSSVLRQLAQCQPSLPECVQTLHGVSGGMKPTLEQLSSTLHVLVKQLPRTFIVTDALDECQLADGSRAQFLDEIFALQSGSNINLFATSRFIMDITERFGNAKSLEIRAHEEDVRRYLAGSMSQLPACVGKNPQLQEEIMARIVEAVDGMFLLAQLHINSLKGKRSAKIIRTALGDLHTGSGAYDKAYDDAMERIAGQLKDQEDLAKQVLMWITCAVRPISIIDLQEALGVELDESDLDPENVPELEDIVSVCAGLVTVDDESNIIRLVHYTTQEYFSRTSNQWFPKAHCNITETCITYLSLDMFDDISNSEDNVYKRLGEDMTVLHYAFEHWVDHASIPESKACNQMVSDFISRRLSTTLGVSETAQRLSDDMKPVIFNRLSSFGRDELAYASRAGNARHVQYLLQRGALINAKDSLGWTPLSGALTFRNADTVKVLLDWDGVDVNRRDSTGETPLFQALESGEREIIDMLLCVEEVDRTVVSEKGKTLLHAAASGGLEDIFRMLLDMDFDKSKLNAPDERGSTPLHLAVERGNVAVVQILVDSDGINIHAKDSGGTTPLHLAARFGHAAMIQMLLHLDPTAMSARMGLSDTPLSLAAEMGREDSIRAILDFDPAAIKTTNFFGYTPLHQAARSGQVAAVRLLYDLDATAISARDILGNTPLSLAAEQGHQDSIRAILNFDPAAIKTTDIRGYTPLHQAAGSGQGAAVRLLYDLDTTAISARTRLGETPLHLGARRGAEAVVQTLLNSDGIEVDARCVDGSTPIHDAACSGNIKVLQLLLNTCKLTVNVEDNEGRTPIWKAVERGRGKAVKYLLSLAGVSTDHTDSRGFTLLHRATERGLEEMVEVLVASERFNVNQTTKTGETPLWFAARFGWDKIIDILLGVDGADIGLNAKDGEGRTALSVAALYTELDKGRVDKYWAPEHNYPRVIKLLKEAHEKFGVEHDGI